MACKGDEPVTFSFQPGIPMFKSLGKSLKMEPNGEGRTIIFPGGDYKKFYNANVF